MSDLKFQLGLPSEYTKSNIFSPSQAALLATWPLTLYLPFRKLSNYVHASGSYVHNKHVCVRVFVLFFSNVLPLDCWYKI